LGRLSTCSWVTGQHWSQTDVGLVATCGGLLGIALQTPIDAAIDVMRAKRGVIVLTMAAMTVAAVIIFVDPSFWPIVVASTQGVGASLSALAAGVAVDHFGYAASFLALGGAAAAAFLVFFELMPETRDSHASMRDSEPLAIEGALGE
jgi:predicted MFS family arabinose efflux permease